MRQTWEYLDDIYQSAKQAWLVSNDEESYRAMKHALAERNKALEGLD